jgi:hypothetical protein
MFIHKFLTAAALAVLGCAVPASADVVGYTSQTNFGDVTTEDTFSNISFTQGNLGDSFSDMGVFFSSSGALMGTTSTALTSSFGGSWPSGTALEVTNQNDSLSITLPASVNAVSFEVGSSDYSITVSVTDNGGGSPDSYTFNGADLTVFLGVATDASFTTFTVTDSDNGGKVAIDNMEIGQETPEVATFLLVGSGLLGMGLMRRRRGQRLLQALAV